MQVPFLSIQASQILSRNALIQSTYPTSGAHYIVPWGAIFEHVLSSFLSRNEGIVWLGVFGHCRETMDADLRLPCKHFLFIDTFFFQIQPFSHITKVVFILTYLEDKSRVRVCAWPHVERQAKSLRHGASLGEILVERDCLTEICLTTPGSNTRRAAQNRPRDRTKLRRAITKQMALVK